MATSFDPQLLRRIADSLGVPRDVEVECSFDDVLKFGYLTMKRRANESTVTIASETIYGIATAIHEQLARNPWLLDP